MDDDVTRYRAYAAECRRDAAQAVDEAREKFLMIAAEWDALADIVEHRKQKKEVQPVGQPKAEPVQMKPPR